MDSLGSDAKVDTLHTSALAFGGVAPTITTTTQVAAGAVAVGHSLPVVINGVSYSLLLS
jgi:hypothetical protein